MLLTRTILSAVFVSAIGGLLWMDHALDTDYGFVAIFVVAVVMSVWEFYDMAVEKGYTPYVLWGTVCAGLMVLADWQGHRGFHPGFHWMGVVGFIFVFGLFVFHGQIRPRKEGLVSMALTGFGVFYVWGLLHFVMRVRYLTVDGVSVGIKGVLLLVVVVKFGDVMAYFVGRSIGKHRPFPNISPKKSIEGYAGGLIGSFVVAGFLGTYFFDSMTWPMALLFAVPVCVFGHIGDLAESIIKRDLGAKDSGRRIPGLGGTLDMLDSLLFAGPVAFYIFEQFLVSGWLRG